MMSHKKPTPLLNERSGKVCPECGMASYSPTGIHPQCAARRADAPREKRLRVERAKDKSRSKGKKLQQVSWKKKCPKCSVEIHVSTGVCRCGHDFLRK